MANRADGGGRYACHSTGTQPGSTERKTSPSGQEGTAHNVMQSRSQLKGSWAGSKMGRKDSCYLRGHGGRREISEQTPFILAQSFQHFSILKYCPAQRKLALECEDPDSISEVPLEVQHRPRGTEQKVSLIQDPEFPPISSRFWCNFFIKNCLKNYKTMLT